jgi:hypothetical protein
VWFGLLILAFFVYFFVRAFRSRKTMPEQQRGQSMRILGREPGRINSRGLALAPYWMMAVSGLAVVIIIALLIGGR